MNSWQVLMIRISFLVLVICHFSCGDPTHEERTDGYSDKPKTKKDSLYHEVMEGHDIGMAKMGKLKKAITAVDQKLDSLGRQAKSAANESDRRSLIKLKEELEYADHAMFQWMEEFNLDSAINDDKKRIDYLESEKVKVIKVRDHILNSLSRADSLLRK